MQKTSRAGVPLLLILLMLVIAACGGQASPPAAQPTAEPPAAEEPTEEPAEEPTEETTEEPAAEATEEPAAEPTEESAAEPETDGERRVLTIVGTVDPVSFDSGQGADYQNYSLNGLMFDSLFERDADGVPQPVLAESYSVSEDRLTWSFKLKEGIEFSDGTPFNAEAVCFTVDQLIDPESTKAHASSWGPVDECNVISEYEVDLVTAEPFGPLLEQVVGGGYSGQMLSPSMGEFGEEMGLHPIGTGPYVLKEWLRGDRVVLERNENYSEVLGPRPYFDEVVWRIVPEATTRLLMLQNGEADLVHGLPPETIATLTQDPNIKILSVPGLWQWYPINTTDPLMSDVRVRQALNHAVDREAIVETLLSGRGTPATGVTGGGFGGFQPVGVYEYNPERAMELLEEAGATGATFTLHTSSGRYPNDSQVAEAVAAQLQAVGLNVEVSANGDWPAYTQGLWDNEYSIGFLGWQANDASLFFFRTLACEGGNWNLGNYCNPDLDEKIADALAAVEEPERTEIYTDLQQTIFDEALGLWMYDVNVDVAMRADLEGVYMAPNTLVYTEGAHYAD